jgi:hypothetical protein
VTEVVPEEVVVVVLTGGTGKLTDHFPSGELNGTQPDGDGSGVPETSEPAEAVGVGVGTGVGVGARVGVGDAAATRVADGLGVDAAPVLDWVTTTSATAATRNAMPSIARAIGRVEARAGATGDGAPQDARVS